MTSAMRVAAASMLAVCCAGAIQTATASAEPPSDTVYMFGSCFNSSQPVQERPARVVYGCDSSSVMEHMTWTAWGADGATGTGIDDAVECRPNCAEGRRLTNPIIVHAWNPLPPRVPGCPDGVEFYADFTVAYPEGVPTWVKPGTSWTEGVDYVYVDGMPAVYFSGQGPFNCTPPAY